jgi:uncharacterized membrane protein
MFDLHTNRNMAGWDRAVSLGVGTALLVHAWKRRNLRGAAGTAGATLLARGASGFCPAYAATGIRSRRDVPERVLSGSGGVNLKESMTVARPPSEVYRFWRNLDNLPSFLTNLVSVEQLDDTRSRWTFRGPGGKNVRWDAVIINEIENELIAWKSLPGADVVSAGSVSFTPARHGGTAVTVTMQYAPPAGKVGAAMAWLMGRGGASEVREDLRRLKQILETGELPSTEGQPTGARSRRFRVVGQVAS